MAAAAALGGACDEVGPPVRGFGSRQLVATSDPTLQPNGWSETSAFYLLGEPPDQQQLAVDLITGQVSAVDPLNPFPPKPGQRFACRVDSDQSSATLTITDTVSGTSIVIDHYYSGLSTCPATDDDQIVVWREAGDDEITLWAGPYTALERVATELTVRKSMMYLTKDTIVVLAAPASTPETLGLFGIATDTFEVTEVVPPMLTSAAPAEGAALTGPLASARLTDEGPRGFIDSIFYYARTMDDGSTVLFAGPFPDGPKELALGTVDKSTRVLGYPYGLSAQGPLTWIETKSGGELLWTWDDVNRRLVSCPWPHYDGQLTPIAADRRRFLLGASPDYYGGPPVRGPLMLVSLDGVAAGGACNLVADSDVIALGFSTNGGSHLFYVQSNGPAESSLWTAAGDGSGVRKIGTATKIDVGHFLDESRLELWLDGDLVWVDVADEMGTLHYVAEKTFGLPIDLPSGWTVTGYDQNTQDDNGTLGVVELATGIKRPISPSVSRYWSVQLSPPPGASRGTIRIAYVVRGRRPSSQDGIWVATISPEDLR